MKKAEVISTSILGVRLAFPCPWTLIREVCENVELATVEGIVLKLLVPNINSCLLLMESDSMNLKEPRAPAGITAKPLALIFERLNNQGNFRQISHSASRSARDGITLEWVFSTSLTSASLPRFKFLIKRWTAILDFKCKIGAERYKYLGGLILTKSLFLTLKC